VKGRIVLTDADTTSPERRAWLDGIDRMLMARVSEELRRAGARAELMRAEARVQELRRSLGAVDLEPRVGQTVTVRLPKRYGG